MITNMPTDSRAGGSPVARLHGLWQGGSAPDLDAFLAGSEDLSPGQLAAVLRIDQRERWQLGQHIPAECYLQRYPHVREDVDGTIDLVYGEFLLREMGGAAPQVEEFLWRFPDLAAVLGPQIALHRALRAIPDAGGSAAVAADESGRSSDTIVYRSAPRPAAPVPLPAMVPGYDLLGELGRGGMGVVYKACHLRLKRLVALKMLLAGAHAGADALARFRREAEAAARLRHPNIVQVYEVGESDGRPFLALEFVDGGSLKDCLGGAPQPARWSAELVEVLARAVHYAHTQGVMHRDLKPSNILLPPAVEQPATRDETRTQAHGATGSAMDRPSPAAARITDFGLAKWLGDQASRGDATRTGDILGTPSYMSPEQAEGRIAEIGPATDVYSLGSILYELLTGRPPFLADTPLKTLQQVATEEPVSPSQLQRQLPRDLVTVCLKCLHKDPGKRYATAGELADDLRRFLNGESVRARPVGAAGRAWRWARRNPVVAGLAAGLIVGAVGGLILVTGLYLHAREQATRAQQAERDALIAAADEKQAREIAQAREAETKAVLRFVDKQILAAARPKGQAGGLGREVTLRQAIEQAVAHVDKSFPTDPLIEARLRLSLGWSFWYLGEAKTASEQSQTALALYTQHRGPDHPDTLHSMSCLAQSYSTLGRHEDALKLREEVLARQTAQLGPDHPDTLNSMGGLASTYADLGRLTDALKLREEVLARRTAQLGPDHPDTLSSMHNLAISSRELGRTQDALKLQEEVLARWMTSLGPDHPDTLRSMHNLANSYYGLGRYREAVKLHDEALARRTAQLGPDHPDTLSSMGNLAIGYSYLGQHAEALKLREETLARKKVKLGPDHPETLKAMHDVAMSFGKLDRHAEATPLFDEVLTRRKAMLGADHPETIRTMHNLALNYRALGRNQAAMKMEEAVVAARKAKLGPDHPDTLRSMHNLAISYTVLDRHEDALKLREEVVAARKAKLGPDHPDTLRSMSDLAISFNNLGRHQDALKLREETLAKRKAKLGPDHTDTLTSMSDLAFSYTIFDRHQEALKLREEVLAARKAKLGPDHTDTLTSMRDLAETYADLGRRKDALKLREELLARQKVKLGPDHPDTLLSMANLAAEYSGLGRHAEALDLLTETLARRKATLGPDHPTTLHSMHCLAVTLNDLGRYQDALKLGEETLAKRTAKLGADHLATLWTQHNLANTYNDLGRNQEALKLREEVLSRRKANLGPDHPDTLLSMWGVADSLVQLDRGAEAVPVIDECVRLAVGKKVDPRLIPRATDLRLRHFEKAKDTAGCRATAELWEKLKRTDADSLVTAARLRAVTAAVVRATDTTDEAARRADAEADRAMAWLKQAVAAGYKDGDHLREHKDLAALRDRPEFKHLLAGLVKK
jgi:tetratricopeptide (TPR) repeat protein